jgi:predicted  nucleic acid-binding Zn-ribbon protein
MPHQCTNCDRTFADGSKKMLSGCPNCGGNKFQFKPEGVESVDRSAEPPEPPEPTGGSSSVAQTVGKTAATVKDIVGGGSEDRSDQTGVGAGSSGVELSDSSASAESSAPGETLPSREDTAQASARSDVVAPDELPSEPTDENEHQFRPVSTDDPEATTSSSSVPSPPEAGQANTQPPTGEAADAPATDSSDTDRPGLEQLREELNDQFESIKVLQPGQYELNLMELYDREEYIVALEEDGRYSIQVPENFRD